MKGKSLIFTALVVLTASCRKDAPETAGSTPEVKARPSRTAANDLPKDGSTGDSGPTAASKASDRSDSPKRPPPAGERIPGSGQVKSPFSSAIVDVQGFKPGDVVKDPTNGKTFTIPEEAEETAQEVPTVPVALAVPGKPGMVFSPFNNKMVDVSGMPAGMLVADPTFPASEKKFFRVPTPVDGSAAEPAAPGR